MNDKLNEAIEVLGKLHNWLDYGAGELEPTANTVMEAIDTVLSEIDAQTRYIKLLEDGILDMQKESENGFCVKFNNEEFMQSIKNREETK